jgi:hypothetical protein
LAFCLSLELRHLGYKKSVARNWALLFVALGLLCSLGYWQEIQPSSVENPATPSQTPNPEPQVAVQVLADKLEMMASQTNQLKAELDAANKALIAVQSATEPRIIMPQQREKFIKILTNINNVSKMNIRVIIGSTADPETMKFADDFRDMLNQAGYGTTNELPELIPNLHVWASHFGANDAEVVMFIADTNEFDRPIARNGVGIGGYTIVDEGTNVESFRLDSTFPYSVFPMYSGTNAVYCYHYTQNQNDIFRGLMTILVQEIRISVGKTPGSGILKPGESGAFFIPPKLY